MIEVVEWGRITPVAVVSSVADQFGVPNDVLVGRRRDLSSMVYRAVAMTACRLSTSRRYSLDDLAEVFDCGVPTVSYTLRVGLENRVIYAAAVGAAALVEHDHKIKLDETDVA